jgi:spermidine/putrescine transport system substrate-binding protein
VKKFLLFLVVVSATLALIGCSQKPKLYVLNWGDYMDPELISAFEKEYGVSVSYKPAGSNEEMATLLQANTTTYDIVIPSDYMIDKLIKEDMLQPINFELLTNFESLDVIDTLYDLYAASNIAPYVVPYAWGTIGILYNTTNPAIKALIEQHGWAALFEFGSTYKVGMYDSARDAVAAALLYKGFHVNSSVQSELDLAEQALKDANFNAWGEDNLKGLVISGNLDMALVYSGDYFSEYYVALEDGIAINFDFYVPESTNVWMDAMVIPKNAQNVELAHKFINFFLREDIAIANSDYIGYAPCYTSVYDALISEEYGYDFETFNPYPEGSIRQMYVYGTDDRQSKIIAILNRAKAAR